MNVIYQIDTYYSSQLSGLEQFKYNNMLIYGSHSVRMYANKINCDYFLLRPEIKINPWITAMFEKTSLFEKLIKSKYFYFAFFDLDIKIKENAINIFDITDDKSLTIDVIEGSDPANFRADRQKKIIKNMTGLYVENYLGAGAFSCGRNVAKKIYNHTKNKLLENLRQNDERFLSYVVDLEKIPLNDLSKFHENYKKNLDFLHYAGNSKEFMCFNYDNKHDECFTTKSFNLKKTLFI